MNLGHLLWLYHQSYLGVINVHPKYFDKLADVIYKISLEKGPHGKLLENKKIEYSNEFLYSMYLKDMLDKLGFLYLSSDKIIENIKELHFCKYYLYNFIFDCKSLLDTIAGLINHHYQIVTQLKERSKIDLKRGQFIEEIKKFNNKLGEEISENKNWINDIVKWRDQLIHRPGINIVWDDKGRHLMPIKPESFEDMIIQKTPQISPIDFCKINIEQAQILVQRTCYHILEDFIK